MYTTVGIALIVFSMVAAEHMNYPYWLFMLVTSGLGGLLIGWEKEKSSGNSEGSAGQGKDKEGR